MKEVALALALIAATSLFAYKTGYNRAQSFYVARIEQTERALKEVLQHSSQTLRELSETIGVDDERDLIILQEIINAAPSAGDFCRVDLDSLRSLDAIRP